MSGEAKQKKVSLIFLPPPLKLRWSGLIFVLLLLCTASCNTTEPPDPPITPQPKATLTLQDVSCLEAWIKLEFENIELPVNVSLLKDSILLLEINNLTRSDTIVYIDSLQPNQTYKFHSVIQPINQTIEVKSNELNFTTLDTTSHNFTWQTFTFGEHSNSILRDVAIIDENNIYAVGTIYLNDSLGQADSNPYAIAHWNGNNWSFIRLYYKSPLGGEFVLSNISGINYVSSSEIWLTAGSIFFWDGISTHTQLVFSRLDLPNPNSTIEKIWGISNFSFWGVGYSGSIVQYSSNQWSIIESGTTVDLLDVWGSPDGTVWACGYNSEDGFTALLRYDGIQWNKVYEGSPNNQNNNEYIGPIAGVWTNSNFFTYVTNWAFIYTQPNNNTLDIKRITPWFSDVAFAMRGTDHNNIFIAGQDGLVGHYNGVTYTEFNELKENAKNYLGVAVKDNIAVAVGVKYGGISSQAVISIGRR